MASRDLADSEAKKGVKATVIAKDGIAVIVNKDSKVDELTSAQVKDIYTGKQQNGQTLNKERIIDIKEW